MKSPLWTWTWHKTISHPSRHKTPQTLLFFRKIVSKLWTLRMKILSHKTSSKFKIKYRSLNLWWRRWMSSRRLVSKTGRNSSIKLSLKRIKHRSKTLLRKCRRTKVSRILLRQWWKLCGKMSRIFRKVSLLNSPKHKLTFLFLRIKAWHNCQTAALKLN